MQHQRAKFTLCPIYMLINMKSHKHNASVNTCAQYKHAGIQTSNLPTKFKRHIMLFIELLEYTVGID